jgi:ribosome-associated protein
MSQAALKYQVAAALRACEEKKAEDIAVLRLDKDSGAFTDYFVLCSGANRPQIQAIADEVEQRLRIAGLRPQHTEGYSQAEWVLLDYVDFVVHVFSEKARQFYALERLWRSATRLTPAELLAPEKRAAGTMKTKKKAAPKKTVRRATGVRRQAKSLSRTGPTGKTKSAGPSRSKRKKK